jgi:hypothetical protein
MGLPEGFPIVLRKGVFSLMMVIVSGLFTLK